MISEIIKNRDRAGEYIYILYFVIMIGARAMGMYEGTASYTVVFAAGMFLFVCKMAVTRHTVREYIIAGALMAIAAAVYICSGEKGLIVCFATMLGMKGVDRIRVIKIGCIWASVMILTRVFTGVFGLLPEVYYPQVRTGTGEMLRHSLGYVHPNTLHMNVLMMSMMIMYLVTTRLAYESDRRRSAGILTSVSVAVLAFNLYVFAYSGSRTGVLALTVYLIVNMILFIGAKDGIVSRIICYGAYPAVCLIAIVCPFILPERLFDLLDRTVFNTRFSLAKYFWSNNHISVFGIRLNNPDPMFKTYGIDMAQLYLFLQLGLAAFAVVSILTVGFFYLSLKKGDTAECAVLVGMLFAGIWEPFLYNLGFKNFAWVFFGAMLYELISVRAAARRQESDAVTVTGAGDGTYAQTAVNAGSRMTGISAHGSFRNVITAVISGVICGCLVSGIALMLTKVPPALYGSRQQDESGTYLGMEEIYLDQSEVDDLKAGGNIIVGYSDENTPMYMYGHDIAVSEYHKRILSLGVWTAMAVCAGTIVFMFVRRKKDTDAV